MEKRILVVLWILRMILNIGVPRVLTGMESMFQMFGNGVIAVQVVLWNGDQNKV